MLKIIIGLVIGFVLGFLCHAIYFPDTLANGIVDVQRVALPNNAQTQTVGDTSDFETKITYDGQFSRRNINIKVGNYLIITNTSSTKPMWLVSNNAGLATGRGYAESEVLKQRMDTPGQFVVADKNNPNEKLVITVK